MGKLDDIHIQQIRIANGIIELQKYIVQLETENKQIKAENRHLEHKINKLEKDNNELKFIKIQLEDEKEQYICELQEREDYNETI